MLPILVLRKLELEGQINKFHKEFVHLLYTLNSNGRNGNAMRSYVFLILEKKDKKLLLKKN